MRRTVGCLAIGLAAVSGCADGGPEDGEEARWTQRGGALVTGTPELVKDLQLPPWWSSRSEGSEPREYVKAGTTLFFSAKDVLHGEELWASDGTVAGTRLVRDIHPGGEDSYPSQLTVFNGVVYFFAHDGERPQLWRSDGTAQGTRPFFTDSSTALSVAELEVVGGTLYFSAGSGWDRELWKSDGTEAGTVLVKDLQPWGSSNPEQLTAVGGTLYFLADDGQSGRELWKSDGTEAGTVLVKDLTPGPAGTFFAYAPMAAVGSTLYLSVASPDSSLPCALWKSDGTDAGTVLVKSFSLYYGYPQQMTAVGGTLFFSAAEDMVSGFELWKSDGTEAGTGIVADLAPSGSTDPLNLTSVGGSLYFIANGAPGLFKTDGTAAGTVSVAPVEALGNFAVAGSRLYFFERQSSYGYWLSAYDTASGVMSQLALFSPSPWWDGQTVSSTFLAEGDTLYFAADGNSMGLEPWKTDGTPEGTAVLADIQKAHYSGSPQHLTDLGGTLLFQGYGENGDTGLWKSDGTQAGTELVMGGFRLLSETKVVDGLMYFNGATSSSGAELWRTDGTTAGTWLVKDIEPSWSDSNPRYFEFVNGKLVFVASTSTSGAELWVSDGTAAGTQLLKDIHPGTSTWGGPGPLVKVGNTVYFPADNGVNGSELWKTDGTPQGTVMVKDLRVGSTGSYPSELRNLNGTLVFIANNDQWRQVLWRLDAAGVPQQVAFAPGASTYSPSRLTVVGNTLFFFADVNGSSPVLWKYDGTSPTATVVAANRFNDSLFYVASAGNALYFVASDEAHGYELWRSDGTSAGTQVVKDILPGPQGSAEVFPMLGLGAQGLVLFRATDGVHGLELWVSDGTEAGTRMVGDIAPGASTSDPREYAFSGNSVFLSANDGTHGDELWRFTLTP
jgi:ELWxxDGT repeat protein